MINAYAYVDGSNLDGVSSQIAEAFANFLPTWSISSARLVNEKLPRTADLRDDDLPDWNLGLNFEAERLSPTEFDQLVSFLSRTAAETQREFVIGGYGPTYQLAEDWGFIGTHVESPTLQFLRKLLVG
ncbi:hypothetical protein GJ699_18695 [Duganella sp. FT80W]|uniref:Uncharacterized protein n=1 Tax=Duganella guangzhouensis TaxID=2666084 RepID=A0A6I2L5T7_9BURK|nr:hypothetical protein [Duganella guangzhouensis]MRW92026.1 hypothetical protein [Duganella guangzhouensis]